MPPLWNITIGLSFVLHPTASQESLGLFCETWTLFPVLSLTLQLYMSFGLFCETSPLVPVLSWCSPIYDQQFSWVLHNSVNSLQFGSAFPLPTGCTMIILLAGSFSYLQIACGWNTFTIDQPRRELL